MYFMVSCKPNTDDISSEQLQNYLQILDQCHYENTPMQIYWKFYNKKKKWKFSDEISDIFHISAQNINCGYSPHRGGSNEYQKSMF